MYEQSRVSRIRRHTAAFLLPALPAVVAMASYAHGHGSLPGAGLGMIVLLAIVAGAAAAIRLVSPLSRSEPSALAHLFRGYRA